MGGSSFSKDLHLKTRLTDCVSEMFNHHLKRVPLGPWGDHEPPQRKNHATLVGSLPLAGSTVPRSPAINHPHCHKWVGKTWENMINPQMVGSSLSVEDMKRFFVHVVVERGLPYCQKLSFPKRCPAKTKNGVTAQAAKDSCQLFTKASAIRAMGTMPFAIGCTKRLDVSYFSYTFSILSLLQAKS